MSTIFRRLRTPIALAALLTLALALPGCGGGYGSYYGGTLEVENDPVSFFDIDAFEVQAGFGPIDHYDVGLTNGDVFAVDLYPDDYSVELFWSDGSSDVFFVSVLDGYTVTVTGLN